MKYVNPDSTHPLDLHSEDRVPSSAKTIFSESSFFSRNSLALGLSAGAIALLGAWIMRRKSSRSFRVRELKIERLEVGELHVRNHDRARSMEESGGVLRFELGQSDVFENGLE